MAADKKSFLLYADISFTLEHLPDELAGKLFKTIVAYVNDENPTIEDLTLKIVFEPIKQQLKRDLRAWEKKREKLSESGKRGAEARHGHHEAGQATPIEAKPPKAIQAVNVTVNDTVSVTDNVNVKKNESVYEPSREEVFKIFFALLPVIDEKLGVRIKNDYTALKAKMREKKDALNGSATPEKLEALKSEYRIKENEIHLGHEKIVGEISDHYYATYQSSGWIDGNKNPIRDVSASVEKWIRREIKMKSKNERPVRH